MMNRKYIISLVSLALLVSPDISAQEGSYRQTDAWQLWRLTDNAAGLSLDDFTERGYAGFDFQHREGDYRRVQEGGQKNELSFQTERYQNVGKYLVGYGKFRFSMDRTQDRAWCDVMRPYNSNPFFGGSSVRGKYDQQQFDLSAALGTVAFGGFRFGARLDYQVGDLSRLRDPRSRSELLDYRVTPAVTYTTGRHTLGLSGHYDRRKEKIPNINTVQQDPNLMYYQMTGMEQATGLAGGYTGYNREWVNHELGAAVSYNYFKEGLSSLVNVGISRGVEDIWGTYKYHPGRYTSYIYNIASRNRYQSGRLLHELDLLVDFTQGFADEYRQQLIQERDADHGYTSYHYDTQIAFQKRYQVRLMSGQLRYRANFLGEQGVQGYMGARFDMNTVKNTHLLPQSELRYDHYDLTLEGGKSFFGDRLWVDLSGGYHLAKDAELTLSDPTTDYAQQVLLPDMQYYDADYWRAHLEVKYLFPLRLKGTGTTWYVKASGDYLKADHSLDAKTVGLSIGIYN